VNTSASPSFLARNEFLLRRLHSLTGLIPVGAYMVVHLLVNSTLLSGPSTFQKNVYQIHSLEDALVLVEWGFIFLPILFHAFFGIVIIWGGLPNNNAYPYLNNFRYTAQRATGIVAMIFIFWHVFHLHGWFHFEGWLENVARPLGGANFRPFNAASTLGLAMSGVVVPVLYAIGVLASVYHLANGIWTMGITWGVWTSPRAQLWASKACAGFGVALACVGLAALYGASTVDISEARRIEQRMYEARTAAGDIKENPHKLAAPQAGAQPDGNDSDERE
jgi:succinate dehydrogenase / fumarate reductase cytochrome b subunit